MVIRQPCHKSLRRFCTCTKATAVRRAKIATPCIWGKRRGWSQSGNRRSVESDQIRLESDSCTSAHAFALRFLRAPPRRVWELPCGLLFRRLRQVGLRTFTSELSKMPSTRLGDEAVGFGAGSVGGDDASCSSAGGVGPGTPLWESRLRPLSMRQERERIRYKNYSV